MPRNWNGDTKLGFLDTDGGCRFSRGLSLGGAAELRRDKWGSGLPSHQVVQILGIGSCS